MRERAQFRLDDRANYRLLKERELSKGMESWTVTLLSEGIKLHLSAREEAERHNISQFSQTNEPSSKVSLPSTPTPPGYRNFSNRLLNSTADTVTNTSEEINFPPRMICLYCKGSMQTVPND